MDFLEGLVGFLREDSFSGGDKAEFFFDGFSGGGRKAATHLKVVDASSVGLDQGGNDVEVGMAGVGVAVDEVGLGLHPEAFHIAVGDGAHLVVGKGFAGGEVEGDVQHLVLGAGVEVVLPLETL